MIRYVNESLRRLWVRLALHGIHYGGRHGRLDALYRIPDPWDMQSPREAYRFGETSRIIKRVFGKVDRLLELGCGEGHQSTHLLEHCNFLYGIDVSSRALTRARNRCPDGIFYEGDIFSAESLKGGVPFDLVVACEVLYYMDDIKAVLNRMSQIGAACFVTYYNGQSKKLDPFFANISSSQRATFSFGETSWNAVWWRGHSPT
jgi:SAM-dependent methyltransferase